MPPPRMFTEAEVRKAWEVEEAQLKAAYEQELARYQQELSRIRGGSGQHDSRSSAMQAKLQGISEMLYPLVSDPEAVPKNMEHSRNVMWGYWNRQLALGNYTPKDIEKLIMGFYAFRTKFIMESPSTLNLFERYVTGKDPITYNPEMERQFANLEVMVRVQVGRGAGADFMHYLVGSYSTHRDIQEGGPAPQRGLVDKLLGRR